MTLFWSHQITFLKRFIYTLLFLTITRLLFLLLNIELFSGETFGEHLKTFVGGVRFDYSSTFTILLPSYLLHQIAFKQITSKWFRSFNKNIFITLAIICISLNFIDIGYYPFQKSRSGTGLFTIMFSGGEIWNLLPKYFLDFWHIAFIYIATVTLYIWKFPSYKTYPIGRFNHWSINATAIVAYSLVFLTVSAGAVRGFGHKPLRIIDALNYAPPTLAPVCLNTSFVILHTLHKEDLPYTEYLSEAKQQKVFPGKYVGNNAETLINKNIVVIILESFSKELVGYFNESANSYTPNLDSLLKKSRVYSNGIANGTRSLEALPSILSSLPQLMDETYITSKYSTNKISSFAQLLKPYGYHSAFFHGGENGTMNFDKFIQTAGFDKYYGMNEYNNPIGFDGNWGIYDHYYLPYTAKELGSFKEPFVASLFTLSSHHPYSIPEQYETRFSNGNKLENAIEYADWSLKLFFDEAKQHPYFANSIFVICADHTAQSNSSNSDPLAKYKIPIAFYDPSGTVIPASVEEKTFEQIDILPTLMELLNFPHDFKCFGESYSQKNINKPSLQYSDGVYQCSDSTSKLIFNGEKTIEFESELVDSLHANTKEQLLLYTKAYIQTYNNRVRLNEIAD